MIEAPLEIQQTLSIPEDHFAACKAKGQPVAGNAAGNTVDVFNLKGQNKSVAPLPPGFTARGIVALVFSCISAFLGMAVIAWCVSMALPRPLQSCLTAGETDASETGMEPPRSAPQNWPPPNASSPRSKVAQSESLYFELPLCWDQWRRCMIGEFARSEFNSRIRHRRKERRERRMMIITIQMNACGHVLIAHQCLQPLVIPPCIMPAI